MQQRRHTAAFVIVLGSSLPFLANSLGPPLQSTGAPALGDVAAELTCSRVSCHIGSPVNFGGQLEILGLPAMYSPGAEYPLTVRLASSAQTASPRWGFQITAARLSDGHGSGILMNGPGLNRSIVPATGRTYISQNFSTLFSGEEGPVEWNITWTAPDPAEGPVGFYAAGNASNGNFATGLGDFIYTTGETTGTPTPVQETTWGSLKRRFPPG
ncbi:MAG TPA: choice-of-anchor V domain-containing protein [Candidatus Eisenbacteria bacterium]|nr:choice-of-anchor V domain-containing protein [Candidatus Eisenbacteria bacterium]